MYKDVHIQGFRGISDIKFDDFKRFNLFVGKNNTCKTSILESLFILVNPTAAELPSKTNLFRGISVINERMLALLFHNFDIEKKITIRANMDDIHKIRSLTIKPRLDVGISPDYRDTSNGERLINERSFQSGGPSIFNGLVFEISFLDFDNVETTYKAEILVDLADPNRPVQLIRAKEYTEHFKGIFISPEYYSPTQTVNQFGNIGVVKKRKGNIIKVLRKIEPSLTDMSIGPLNMIYCDLGLDQMLPINVMGGGIVKILSAILAIEDNEDGVVFIDEIENGLFHTSQGILWKAIFASANEFNVQVFATTHSIECIKSLGLASSQGPTGIKDDVRVYRIEKQKEGFRVVKFIQKDIELVIEKDWDIR